MILVLFAILAALMVARWINAYLRFRRLELAIPGPPSLPVLGNTLAFANATEDDIFDILMDLWGGRSEMTRFTLGPMLNVFVQDPDDIEKVMRGKETQEKANLLYPFMKLMAPQGIVTARGETWRTHRRAYQPAFHNDVLDRYQDIFNDECSSFCAQVNKIGVSEDLGTSLRIFLTKSVLRTIMMYSVQEEGKSDAALPAILKLLHVFSMTTMMRSLRPWLWPDFLFGFSASAKTLRDLLEKVDECCYRILSNRRTVLQQEKAASVKITKERRTLIDILLKGKDAVKLDEKQMVDEMKAFCGAAVESSLSTIGWVFKVLSSRPDIQDRILEEVEAVRGKDEAFTTHHVSKLEYTERVMKEALRLLPAIAFVARNASSEFVLNDKTIPKGSTVIVNIYGAHRDPRHWEEPLKFDPDRFLPERSVGRHPYAYLAFSAGPRNCIGTRFALVLIKTFLATVVSRYRIDPVDDGHTDPAKFPITTDIVTGMKGGFRVAFHPRAQVAA